MKTRKNKKPYNFTEKQKRKDKSVKRVGWWNAPKDYVRGYNVKFRRECKQVLHYNITNSEDKAYPLSGRHTANWDFW